MAIIDKSIYGVLTNQDVRSNLVNSDEVLNVFNDVYDIIQSRLKVELDDGRIDATQYVSALQSSIESSLSAGFASVDSYNNAIRDRARIQSDVIFGLASSGALADYDSSNTSINVARMAQQIDYKLGQEDSQVFLYTYTDDTTVTNGTDVLSTGMFVYNGTGIKVKVEDNTGEGLDLISGATQKNIATDSFLTTASGDTTAIPSVVLSGSTITGTMPTNVYRVRKWDAAAEDYDHTYVPASVAKTALSSKDVFTVSMAFMYKIGELRVSSKTITTTCIKA